MSKVKHSTLRKTRNANAGHTANGYWHGYPIQAVRLADIKPYENNPRKNAAAVPAVVASIKAVGFINPIVLDADNTIINGHTRRLAALKLKMERVPCIKPTDLSPEQVRLLRIADNKSSELSDWDFDKLGVELDSLADDFELGDFGFTDIDEAPIEGNTDADAVTDTNEPTVSKRGEVYQCGDHRLMCGDSTNSDDFKSLMRGELADIVFTDPPYGVAYSDKNEFLNAIAKGNRNTTPIENDDRPPEEMYNFWLRVFGIIGDFTKQQMAFYIAAPVGILLLPIMTAIQETILAVRHTIIWNKNNHVLGRCDYNYKHELILYGWKKKGTHRFYGGGKFKTTVWDIPKPLKSELHPTMKPVELVENCLLDCSAIGDIALDAFGGSGTTMIAAERLKRKARLMELDPHYCDVIRKRWAEFVHGEGCDWKSLTPKIQKGETK